MFDVEGMKWILLKDSSIKEISEDGVQTKTAVENWCIENNITGYAGDIIASLNSVKRFQERVKNAVILTVRIAQASTGIDYFPSFEVEAARDGMGILLQEFLGSGGLMDCGDISEYHNASKHRVLYFREIGWGKRVGRDGEVWNAALQQAYGRFARRCGLDTLVFAPCQDFQSFTPEDNRSPFGIIYDGERMQQVAHFGIKLSEVTPEEFSIWRIPLLPTLEQAVKAHLVSADSYQCEDVKVERLRCIRALAAWCLVKSVDANRLSADVDHSYDRGGFFSVIGTPSQWADIVNHLRRLELLAAGYTPEEVGLNARLYLQKRADTDGNWRRII